MRNAIVINFLESVEWVLCENPGLKEQIPCGKS